MELNCGENKSKMPKKKVWKQEKFEKIIKNCDSFYYGLNKKELSKTFSSINLYFQQL